MDSEWALPKALVTAELQSPFQNPWSVITRDDPQVSGTTLFPLHGVIEDLQTLQAVSKCSNTSFSTQTDPVTNRKTVMGRTATGVFFPSALSAYVYVSLQDKKENLYVPKEEEKHLLIKANERTIENSKQKPIA